MTDTESLIANNIATLPQPYPHCWEVEIIYLGEVGWRVNVLVREPVTRKQKGSALRDQLNAAIAAAFYEARQMLEAESEEQLYVEVCETMESMSADELKEILAFVKGISDRQSRSLRIIGVDPGINGKTVIVVNEHQKEENNPT